MGFFYYHKKIDTYEKQFWHCCKILSEGMVKLGGVQRKNTAIDYAKSLDCEPGIFMAAVIYSDIEYSITKTDMLIAVRRKLCYKM